MVQRKAETQSKGGRELPCKVVKFRSVLLLQLAAVESYTTYTLSYLVVVGKREVGTLPLEGLILCCQGYIIKQILYYSQSVCKVYGRHSTEVTVCCYGCLGFQCKYHDNIKHRFS